MIGNAEADKIALSPGSDLWIVPERKNSSLVPRLDWYLNFQIAKSSLHHRAALPPAVSEILKECALEGYDWAPEESEALLILASPFLPCRWVMVLKNSSQFDSWVKAAVEKWKKMNSPTVRIFLPHEVSASDFRKIWKKEGGSDSVIIVTDKEEVVHG